MPTINTGDLEPGMVLARDLRSPQGRLLLPEGETIAPEHIRLCKRWGIMAADVRNVSSDEVADRAQHSFPQEIRQRSKALAVHRFTGMQLDDAVSKELVRQFLLRVARMLAAGVSLQLPEAAPERRVLRKPLEKLPHAAELAADNPTLASLPQTYGRIVDVLEDPNSSAAYVAEVISSDSSLSARLLRLVNSPFYGFQQRVDSLDRAVTLVGSNQLSSLALGISVFSLFKGIPSALFSMHEYCRHSVTCGVVARYLAGHVQGVSRERMFALGLLHDIGRLVVCMQHPLHGKEALELAFDSRQPPYELERRIWGFDHAEVSGALLTHWQLPQQMCLAVAGHHPPFAPDAPKEALLLHVADCIAHALTLDMASPFRIPSLDNDAWQQLGLRENVLAWAMGHCEALAEDMLGILMRDAA